jgi:hypothetical protein
MQSTKDKVKLKVMEALGHSLVLLKIKTKPIYYTSNLDLDA